MIGKTKEHVGQLGVAHHTRRGLEAVRASTKPASSSTAVLSPDRSLTSATGAGVAESLLDRPRRPTAGSSVPQGRQRQAEQRCRSEASNRLGVLRVREERIRETIFVSGVAVMSHSSRGDRNDWSDDVAAPRLRSLEAGRRCLFRPVERVVTRPGARDPCWC